MRFTTSVRAAGAAVVILACLGGVAAAGNVNTNAIRNSGVLKKQLPPSPTTPVQNLQCVVDPPLSITIPNVFSGGSITSSAPQQVVITNSLSTTIPAGTAYSYSFQGGHYLSTDHTKLAPGKPFTIGLDSNFHITSQIPCTASIPL